VSVKQIAFVREAEASGRVAEIFADILQVMDVGTVNLIWRHLAVEPAVLEGAWQATRPFYSGAGLAARVHDFVSALERPSVSAWPSTILHNAGVDGHASTTLAAVLDTYNRGNAYNLLTLSALLVEPEADYVPASTQCGDVDAILPAPNMVLPAVPEMDEMSAVVAELVLDLNRLGNGPGGEAIVATLYKHIALWPGFLNLVWAKLEPMHRDGELQRLINDASACALVHARGLATQRGRWPPSAHRDNARAAIQSFIQHAICRMLPIGQLLRRSLRP